MDEIREKPITEMEWSITTETLYRWLKEHYREKLLNEMFICSHERDLCPDDFEDMVDYIYWNIRAIVDDSIIPSGSIANELIDIALSAADYRAIAQHFIKHERLNCLDVFKAKLESTKTETLNNTWMGFPCGTPVKDVKAWMKTFFENETDEPKYTVTFNIQGSLSVDVRTKSSDISRILRIARTEFEKADLSALQISESEEVLIQDADEYVIWFK